MLNKFLITYANGASEEVQSSNATAELQANSSFGMGLEQASEMGCNVELVETLQEDDEFVATEGRITSFSKEKQAYAYTLNDYSDKVKAGHVIVLTATGGTDEAKAAVEGNEVNVIETFPLGFITDLDLSEVDVTGLTADFNQNEPMQVENPVPTPPEQTDENVDPRLVTFRYLTRDKPTTGMVSAEDARKIKPGDTLTLTSAGGLQDMMEQADGRSGEVMLINGTNVQMNIDMTDIDTTGLVMTAIGSGDGQPDMPEEGDRTGTITAFTAQMPTVATMDEEDTNMLEVGDFITLEALSGDPEVVTLIHGQRVEVTGKDPVTLAMDLEGYNVTDLKADFLTDEPAEEQSRAPVPRKTSDSKKSSAPAPSPAPSPAPKPSSTPAPAKAPPAPLTPSWAQPSEPEKDRAQAAKDATKPTPNVGGAPLTPAPKQSK